MKKIFWIASYPKSGNTWMRLILKNIFFNAKSGEELHGLNYFPYFEVAKNYQFIKDINIDDFNNLNQMQVIAKYRVKAQENIKINGGDFGFFKTHSSNLKIKDIPYTNEKTTLGFFYLIRDPREIAVSYASHQNINIDEVIDIMTNHKAISLGLDSIPMHQSRWDQNILSWNKLKTPNLFIKYEDMLENYENIIYRILDFFEKNFNFDFKNKKNVISVVLKNTKFNKLKEIENKKKFAEQLSNNFFRSGKKDSWKSILSNAQITRIEKEFQKTMKFYDYL